MYVTQRGAAGCRGTGDRRDEADFSPATNLPRKTRLMTLMGRKKRPPELIQLA